MDPSDIPAGSPSPPKKELQPQGPQPAPLKVRKDSYKIKKPPLPPRPPPPPPPPKPQPVKIHSLPEKVIRTTASDFMSLVQRLTGLDTSPIVSSSSSPSSSSSSSSSVESSGANVVVPPAAHFASIETGSSTNSPSEGEESRNDS